MESYNLASFTSLCRRCCLPKTFLHPRGFSPQFISDAMNQRCPLFNNSYGLSLLEVSILKMDFSYICSSVSSVAQLCLTLCDPMDGSMPGLPVHHQLPELTQTHVHRVGNAIQPSHPLSTPSPPVLNLPSIRVFSNQSVLHIRWPRDWSFSFGISPSNE